jgi:hypothetical protein
VRRLAITLAAISSTLTLAACGSDDADEKNDYVDEVNAVTQTLNKDLAAVANQGTSATSAERSANLLKGFSEDLAAAVTKLEEITPPEDVASAHDQLVADVTELRGEAANARDEIRAGGPASIGGVTTQFVIDANRISGDIDSTITEINDRLQE